MKGISLVTGGASGLGKAAVKALVRNGYRVGFCDIQKQRGYKVVEEMGGEAMFVPGDITSEENVLEVLQAMKDKFGKLDSVINCAAIHSAFKVANFTKKTCHNLTDFERVVKVNTIGTFNVIRLSAKMLSENSPDADGHRGTIINTACLTAYDGQIGQSCLAASKAAVAGMTLPLAREFAPQGIRVNAIAAGLFDTPLLAYLPPNVLKFLGDCSPFPSRLGYPEEFAHLVINILKNSFVNGEVIRLDGANRMSTI